MITRIEFIDDTTPGVVYAYERDPTDANNFKWNLSIQHEPDAEWHLMTDTSLELDGRDVLWQMAMGVILPHDEKT